MGKKKLTCLSLQVLKYSWAIDDASQAEFSWTHETKEHMFAVFDSFRANEHQLKIHRNHEVLMTVEIVKEIKKANNLLKITSQKGVELLENQIPTIVMFRRTDLLIAMRYSSDDNKKITRIQLRLGSVKEFDEALERLKALNCPLVDKAKPDTSLRGGIPSASGAVPLGLGVSSGVNSRLPSMSNSTLPSRSSSSQGVPFPTMSEPTNSATQPAPSYSSYEPRIPTPTYSHGNVGTMAPTVEEHGNEANRTVETPAAMSRPTHGSSQTLDQVPPQHPRHLPLPAAVSGSTETARPVTAPTAPLSISNHLPPVRQLPHHRPRSSLSRPSVVENLATLRRPSYAVEKGDANERSQVTSTQPVGGTTSKRRKLESAPRSMEATNRLLAILESSLGPTPSTSGVQQSAANAKVLSATASASSVTGHPTPPRPISSPINSPLLTSGSSRSLTTQRPSTIPPSIRSPGTPTTSAGQNDTVDSSATSVLFDMDAQMTASLQAYNQLDRAARRTKVDEMLTKMIMNDDFLELMKDLEGCVNRWGFDVEHRWGQSGSE
ncbi:hypothetical protein P152DRAFT_482452 [Eremomyces bilateralis CBS 781.70]|uniref:Uncharacterized protein n=1 Tax=Eremomyces bilateralis CBS 781.70 TaxID=1392243 RepID=A0A6G1G1S6_9PEZI|nr:uncharacterized protein P152DRAFT_482452 [Eremomyces bilateralis CBS 781.70]KAF1811876.1 hypothetical protein P152DRAFT_482452 [Eremomyces bilateralis CBS 781.70]